MQLYTTDDIANNPGLAAARSKSLNYNLHRQNPAGTSPIFALTGLAKTKMCKDITYAWFTKKAKFPQVTLTAAVTTAVQTALACTTEDAQYLVPGSIIRHRAAGTAVEHMIISTVDYASGALTVLRGQMGTTAYATIASATVMPSVGNASEQGSSAPDPVAIATEFYTNFTQIVRNSWGIANTTAAVSMDIGEGNKQENRRDCGHFHGEAIEKIILFGRKGATIRNGRPLTTAAGLEQIIADHAAGQIYDAGATTTFAQLEVMLDPCLDQNIDGRESNTRDIYCGSVAYKVFNDIGKLSGQYELLHDQRQFGLQFKSFNTTRGTFNLIEHPILNTNADYRKMAFVLDLAGFDIRWLRPTEHVQYGSKEQAGLDAEGGVLTSEFTIEHTNPLGCAVIHGLTAAAA